MFMMIFYELSIIIYLFVMKCCVQTAIVDTLSDNKLNSIDDQLNNQKYDKTDKCEIRIVTIGVCKVNNHLVKPTIQVKVLSRINKVPDQLREVRRNEERVRNMDTFKIEQDKGDTLVDQFLIKFKEHFGPQIDPMSIKKFGRLKLKNTGLVNIYDLKLSGISNIQRHGSVRLHSDSQMKLWTINANLSIDNITADFKVDAKLKHRVFIKGWDLQVLIGKCLLNAIIEYDSRTKMMTISSLKVDTIEGFTLNSENLSAPFSEVVRHILEHQMNDLKSVISTNAQKYLSQTLRSFDVTKIVDNVDHTIMKSN